MELTVGDFVSLAKGGTIVTGQLMGYRIDQIGEVQELWVDGFYSGFTIGKTDLDWQVIDDAEI